MTNWVYNYLSGYSKEMYDKYKSDDGQRDIDFNKIVPEPKELLDIPCGSFNQTAKNIYQYNQYNKNIGNESVTRFSNMHLRKEMREFANATTNDFGVLAIQNPDKSLNQIIADNKQAKSRYDDYVSVFGNKVYYDQDRNQAAENYIKLMDRRFKECSGDDSEYAQFKDLNDFGEKLAELQEKYGFDNWYDWRHQYWGVKWNAYDTNYDEETKEIKFDTAWSIPYPIIAKIAEQNPETKLEGYSEEETGWFNEYHTEKNKLFIDVRGDITWDEDIGNPVEQKEKLDPPILYNPDEEEEDG